jgi:peptide/nickel transport system substrate-binding protein
MLAAKVQSGQLPAVEDRLPSEPMVVSVVDKIGEYGGTWRRAFTGPNDGQNADRLMMDFDLYFDLDGTAVIPNIGKSYEVSSDGLTYTLNLRAGMKWSDGTAFTAQNYQSWWDNVILNEEINPGRNGQLGWSGYSPTGIKAVDDSTVQFTLSEAADGFLDQLATYRIGGFTLHGRIADGSYGPWHYMKDYHRDFVADKAAYDAEVEAAGHENWVLYFKEKSNPLRNGEVPVVSPWFNTSPITEQIYTWERNPYYWAVDPAGNQLPYIDKISMILTGEKEVLNLKAIAGEIDFQHRHIDMAKVPVIRENEAKCNCVTQFWPSPHGAQAGVTVNNTYGLGSNLDYTADPEIQKWLLTKDFRVALSQGINRQKINEVVFLGLGTVMQPVFIKGHPFYPGDEVAQMYTKRDIAASNALLDSIGLTAKDGDGYRLRTDGSGDTLQFELAYIANYFVDYEGIAEVVHEDWKEIGIKTNLKAEDVKLFADRRGKNEHQMIAGGAGGQRYPLNLSEWFSAGQAYRNWYQEKASGTSGGMGGSSIVHVPTDPNILRLAELTDEAKKLRYPDRKANYIEVQTINVTQQYMIGAVGATPAFNGVIVKKKYFKNVPLVAPNQSALQNPGIARTIQFYLEGGKNDGE